MSSNPIPVGFPTPYNTGLRGIGVDPDDLTDDGGGTYSTADAVIEDLDFTGTVNINASGITIRRCRITTTDFYGIRCLGPGTNLTIEDCRIRLHGVNSAAAILATDGITISRCDISGGADSVKFEGDGIVMEDCYLAGNMGKVGVSHNDVIQTGAGDGMIIRRCSIIGPWQQQTSAILMKSDFAAINDVLVEDSYMSGGNYTIQFVVGGGGDVTNIVMTDNTFDDDSWNFAYLNDGTAGDLTETGSVFV